MTLKARKARVAPWSFPLPTRRQVLAAIAGVPFLAACGAETAPSTGPSLSGAQGSAAPAKRTIQTPRGPVEVPAKAERVVVFDRRGTLAYLLDLGIRPIASMTAPQIYGGKSFHPLLDPDISGIATISSTAPDLEQVAALRPDLIVGYTGDSTMEKGYQQLSGIAPTVAAPIDFNAPEDELTFLGTVFGLEEKAASLRAAFKADVARAASKARNLGTVSIVLPVAEGVRLYSSENLAGQIVKGLGGSVVPDLTTLNAQPGALLALVSFEQISAITGETVLLLVNLAPELRVDTNKLLESPLFKALPAVRANRLIEIESQATFGTAGLRGQRQVLEQLSRVFA